MAEETKKQISWTAPEFIHYQKGTLWFVAVGVVGLILVLVFAFQKDFLTAILFALLTALVLYFSRQKPRMLDITLSDRGVQINEVKMPFDNIKNFWIVYEPPEIKTLNFETTAYLNRYMSIQLADQDPVEVRKLLLEHLPEDLDKEESMSDKLSRKIGF